jgi:transcriptional antiterminator NusG
VVDELKNDQEQEEETILAADGDGVEESLFLDLPEDTEAGVTDEPAPTEMDEPAAPMATEPDEVDVGVDVAAEEVDPTDTGADVALADTGLPPAETAEAEVGADTSEVDEDPTAPAAAGGGAGPEVTLTADPEAAASAGAAADAALAEEERREQERRAKMRWYVIHANTGHENKVKRNIEIAIKSNHMEEFFGEVLVATQEVTEMKNGKRSTVKRKFFPSYVLVEMIMNKTTQHFINSIPGVTRFVGGTPLQPEPITKEEVDRILGRISAPQDTKTLLEIPYQVGESVQVIDGPFTDWIGVINEINQDKGKLKVMISIFGSETPVELDFLQVKSV